MTAGDETIVAAAAAMLAATVGWWRPTLGGRGGRLGDLDRLRRVLGGKFADGESITGFDRLLDLLPKLWGKHGILGTGGNARDCESDCSQSEYEKGAQ